MAIVLTDDFTGTDSDPWDSGKWTTSSGGPGGTVNIQSNTGQLAVAAGGGGNSGAQAIGDTTALDDAEVLLNFVWNTTGIGTNLFRVFLRGSADWVVSRGHPTTAYYVEKGSASASNFELMRRESDGTITVLDSTPTLGNNDVLTWLRFRVEGTQLQARVWHDGDTEPGTWSLEAIDSVLTSGVLQLVHQRSGNNLSVFVDDLTLEELAAAGGITIELAGTLPALTGNFGVAAESSVELAGQLPALTGSFDVEANSEIELTGTLPSLTGTFAISEGGAPTAVALDGTLPALTGTFDVASTAGIELAGTLPALTGSFDVEAGAILSLSGELPALTGSFTIAEAGALSPSFISVVVGPLRDPLQVATMREPMLVGTASGELVTVGELRDTAPTIGELRDEQSPTIGELRDPLAVDEMREPVTIDELRE